MNREKEQRLLEILKTIGSPVTAEEIFERTTVRWRPDEIDRTLYVLSRAGKVRMSLHHRVPHFSLPNKTLAANGEIQAPRPTAPARPQPAEERPAERRVRVPKYPTEKERRELEAITMQVTRFAELFMDHHRQLEEVVARLDGAQRSDDAAPVGERRDLYYRLGSRCYKMFDDLDALLGGHE